MGSRAGQFLLASPNMRDSNFSEAVVLILEDDDVNGVLGVVLNRISDISLQEGCADISALIDSDHPLYQGGPCDGPLLLVHSQETLGKPVAPGLVFTTERSDIEQMLIGETGPVRFFAGYSGWSPGQLEEEIEAGAWLLHPGGAPHVFGDAKKLWHRLKSQVTLGRWIDTSQIPDDSSSN